MSKDQQRILTSAKSISLKVGLATSFALFVLLAILPASWAQSGRVKSTAEKAQTVVREEKFSPADSELQMSDAEMKHYIKGKYMVDKIGAGVGDDRPQHRSKRRTIKISGNLTPKKVLTPKEGKLGLQRAAAEAFVAEEGERLFGVSYPAEIREFSASSDQYNDRYGITVIWYKRYVGDLPLEGATVVVTAKEDGTLTRVTADLVPVTNELREAVKRPTLSEAEIRAIIRDDLKKPGAHRRFLGPMPESKGEFPTAVLLPRVERLEKEAIPVPPYVIWRGEAVWEYEIDAFSGKIMKRLQGWQD